MRSQAEAILATDFIETVTLTGQRQYILAAIHHTSRRVRILGSTAHPTRAWVTQAIRNLLMDLDDTGHLARIIDAGRGLSISRGATFLPTRLVRSFDITYAKAQDATRAQLNQAAESGQLRGFVHTYLAIQDHKLPAPLADLVPRSAVVGSPTTFGAMSAADLDLLAGRGEQLTRVLLAHYWPGLTG